MEFLAFPLGLIALGIVFWMIDGGPQNFFVQRRRIAEAKSRTAEANARAEQARLERARLERGR